MNQLSIVWNVNPEIFHLGGISIRWYGIMFALAFVVSYILLKKMFLKDKVNVAYLDKLAIYVFVAVLVGARLGHCLFYDFAYYSHHLIEMILPIRKGAEGWRFIGYQGLASHGGAIGILIALYIYAKRTKLPYMWVVDRLVIAICFAGFCIRFGNLMNSEIYGKATSLPWGFVFLQDGSTIPSHPTQLYEALSYLTIGIVLYCLIMSTKKAFNQGMIFGIFLTAVFGIRFLLEFLKNDQEAWEETMLINMGQILSIPFIIAGIVFIILAYRKDIGNKLNIKQLK